MHIAGDIGGTKTILGAFTAERGPRDPVVEATYRSENFGGLSEVVADFLSQIHLKVSTASFGVAGPVVEGKAQITNLPWLIESQAIQEEFGFFKVHLLNDLVSIANAVPILLDDDLYTLNVGDPVAEGAIAVIAPGTGLGEAFLTWDGSQYRAHPSEGGHSDFAPTNELEIELLSYFERRYQHVSYELICSGRGLPNIYTFLRDAGYGEEPEWLTKALKEAHDPTPLIVKSAMQEPIVDLCKKTVDLFVSILGAEAGNLALKLLATGGVFLAGGIPPRILPKLASGIFMRSFVDKGRFSGLLSEVPIKVILNAKSALYGAACFGLNAL